MTAGNDQLAKCILASPRRVVAVLGPAGSGKTSAALNFYRHFQREGHKSGCLLIAPNIPAIGYLKRALLEGSPCGAIMAAAVTTFASVASRILGACGVASRLLPAYRRRLLLRQIIDELKCQAGLSALSAIADSPGLVVALDRTISELKRAAVDPDALAAALGPRRSLQPDKSRDLLEIYRRYQAAMQVNKWYDVEGQLWLARDCLLAGPDKTAEQLGLGGVTGLAVDGFTDFTPTQLEILALLARRVDKLLITLPWAHDGRGRLWQWTQRTLDRIRHTFAADLDEFTCPPATLEPLSPIWQKVFDIEAKPATLPTELSLTAAAGLDAEVATAARQIKRALADGAPAGSIAVLSRSLDTYRPIIQRIFAEHDIPLAEAPVQLTDVPIIRFALDAASLGPDFEFQNVLRVIKSSYFQPSALGPFDASTVATAEAVIRQGNVLLGRQAYDDAVARLSRSAKAHAQQFDPDEADSPVAGPLESSEAIDAAGQMFRALFGVCLQADLSAIVSALNLQAAALSNGSDELIARDLRALATLNDVLDGMAGVRIASTAPAVEAIREALDAVACPPARSESLVDVLDVLDARAVRYKHVFLLGVSEGQFPQRLSDSPLLGEADRAVWATKGIVLDSPGDLISREMLLFYLAISRGELLTISYLQADAAGKAQSAGNFLLSMLEPFGGLNTAAAVGQITRVPPGQFVPPPDEIASPRDAFNAGVAGFFASNDDIALAWAATNAPDKINQAVMGIWARHRRWTKGPCNEFDGRLNDPHLLASLHRRFSAAPADGGTVFSASQLNSYGLCPWQYFATYILKLTDLIVPQRELEAVGRGIFCHNTLYRMMSELRRTHGSPVCIGTLPQTDVMDALDMAILTEAGAVEAGAVAYPLLWRLQKEQMARQLRTYVKELAGRGAGAGASLNFELTFGMEQFRDELGDSASTSEPIVIQTPAGPIPIKGKIDRVDQVVYEGADALLIVDYKTGALPTLKDILAGRNVQLQLYRSAAAVLLGRQCLGGVFHRIGDGDKKRQQYFAAAEFDGQALEPVENFDENFQAAMDRIGQFITGMRAGRFDQMVVEKCSRYCAFRTICQFSPARQEIKTQQEPQA